MKALLALLAVTICAGLFGSAAYAQQIPAPAITFPAPSEVITSNTFTVTGSSVPGYTIVVVDPSFRVLGSTMADSNGDWSVEIQLQDGTHTITVAAYPDPADLSRVAASTLVITVGGDGTPAGSEQVSPPSMRDDMMTAGDGDGTPAPDPSTTTMDGPADAQRTAVCR